MSRQVKNLKALAPIIGTIMMVAVAIISAAIFFTVIGPNPLESTPQTDIQLLVGNVGSDAVIKLVHQGGEDIFLTEAQTTVIITGSSSIEGIVSYSNLVTESDRKFTTGDSLYLYIAGGNVCIGNNTLPSADHTDIVQSGETVEIKVLDVNSQQLVTDTSITF